MPITSGMMYVPAGMRKMKSGNPVTTLLTLRCRRFASVFRKEFPDGQQQANHRDNQENAVVCADAGLIGKR
jgi:hypothetical protein